MEYQKIIQTIESKRRFGNLPGIEISRKLLAAAGDPQKDLAFIHIAGTNGKGSVAAFLHAILKEAGIKTGLFTSPHLVDFEERIRINGEKIPKQEAARLGQYLLDISLDVHPTMFDYCLAMALLYFKEQGCRLVVLETGLGGRLDSTNVIDVPFVSIITKIGYDHMSVLGNTLPEIAAEKAGILKTGTRAVLESQKPEVMEVLKQRCACLGIPFKIVDAAQIRPTEGGFSYLQEQMGSAESGDSHPNAQEYQMKMLGIHQRENAAAAILAAKELAALGYPVTPKSIQKGIASAVWEGRMEVVCEQPFLLIDGAHNADGVTALVKSLQELYPGERFHFIIGILADKDYKRMIEPVLPMAERVTAVTPESERALAGEELAEYIRSKGVPAVSGTSAEEMLKPFGKKSMEESDSPEYQHIDWNMRTVAFGSLYFIGEIRRIMCKG